MTPRPPEISLELLDTGHCVVPERMVLRGGSRRPIECHALVGLIRHPRHGLILFDTGYAPRLLEATRRWPERLYRYVTPLRLRPELAAAAQLKARGIDPDAVGHVIVSHFHADHVAGLRDFPRARLVASAEALAQATSLRGFAALRRGIIPALLPDNLGQSQALLAVTLGRGDGPEVPHLGPAYDLFDDGSILLVGLPGHARGQLGAILQNGAGPVLLAADGAWTSRSIRELRPPARRTDLLADDPRAVLTTLRRLNAYARAHPEVLIVPTHCPEVYAALGAAALPPRRFV